jgi:hypothetical protein
VRIERDKKGKWSFLMEKKAASDGVLKAVVGKLGGIFKRVLGKIGSIFPRGCCGAGASWMAAESYSACRLKEIIFIFSRDIQKNSRR